MASHPRASIRAAGDASAYVAGITCRSATFCVAVGNDAGGALIETWNGTAWTRASSPSVPAGALGGVSCPTSSRCVAVGLQPSGYDPATDTYGPDVTLVETTSDGGHTWTIVPSPNAAGHNADSLNDVSCVSSTSCTAVGDYLVLSDFANQYAQPLIETWNGHSWTLQRKPRTVSTAFNYVLTSVACQAHGCTAAGYWSTFDFIQNPNIVETRTLLVTGSGAGWTMQPSQSSSTEGYDLYGVSCPASASCTAVGDQFGTGLLGPFGNLLDQTFAMTGAGSSWSPQPTANVPYPGNDALYGVSCLSSGWCAAVGYQQPIDPETGSYGPGHSLAEIRRAGTWTVQSSPSGTPLATVSCVSSSFCMAGGQDIESWNGSHWTVLPSPA